MKDLEQISQPWKEDGLGYDEIGQTFTNLIKSIEDSKVISIEAGFGHGKTFFRNAWAQHLRASGELVIEIDAQQSDHSGDPIITFMGALLKATPVSGKPLTTRLKDHSLHLAGLAGRSFMRAVLRSGADEVLEKATDWFQDKAPDITALDKAVDEIKSGLSNAAAQMIATHLAAETARTDELPAQIDRLRDALTEGAPSKRIIILIDELDRCHPEYAIALLEAMKLVFGREGFVFCLMVNPHYLESIARHRFGPAEGDELYLDKFVDLRLALKATAESQGRATADLVRRIEVEIPFGTDESFSSEAAAELASQIVQRESFSFRQIKRAVQRVELVTRCYRERPIDLPLLVFLAFSDIASNGAPYPISDLIPRAMLTPNISEELLEKRNQSRKLGATEEQKYAGYACESFVNQYCQELTSLERDRYVLERLPPLDKGRDYYAWYKVLAGLGPTYIPSHRAMLDGVHKIMAP